MKETKNKFIKIRCAKCKNEQITYDRTSTTVLCLVCNTLLAVPTGGKTEIKGRVLEVLE